MVDRRRIARRLGGPAARRRRHKRVAMLLAVLLLASVGLTMAGASNGDDEPSANDDQLADPTTAACVASNAEIAMGQRLLIEESDADPEESVPGFFGNAFVDLMRERERAIADSAPPEGVRDLLTEQAAVVDAIEADPSGATGMVNPFDEVNQRWRDLGLPDCAIDSSTVRERG